MIQSVSLLNISGMFEKLRSVLSTFTRKTDTLEEKQY